MWKFSTKFVLLLLAITSCQAEKREAAVESDTHSFYSKDSISEKKSLELDSRTTFKYSLSPLLEILDGYDLTSSRSNQLPGVKYENDELFKFGTYHLISRDLVKHQKNPIVGHVHVRFKDLPWRDDDPSQEVLFIEINQAEFEMNLPFHVGEIDPCLTNQYKNAKRWGLGETIVCDSCAIQTYVPFNNIGWITIRRTTGQTITDTVAFKLHSEMGVTKSQLNSKISD